MKVSGEVFRRMCWLAVALTATVIVRYSINLEGWLFRVFFAGAILVAGLFSWTWPRIFLGTLTLNEQLFEYDGLNKTWVAPVLGWFGAGVIILTIPFAFAHNDEAFGFIFCSASGSGLMIGARMLQLKQSKDE